MRGLSLSAMAFLLLSPRVHARARGNPPKTRRLFFHHSSARTIETDCRDSLHGRLLRNRSHPRAVRSTSCSFDIMDEVGRPILSHHPLGIANPVRRERGGTKFARVGDQRPTERETLRLVARKGTRDVAGARCQFLG